MYHTIHTLVVILTRLLTLPLQHQRPTTSLTPAILMILMVMEWECLMDLLMAVTLVALCTSTIIKESLMNKEMTKRSANEPR